MFFRRTFGGRPERKTPPRGFIPERGEKRKKMTCGNLRYRYGGSRGVDCPGSSLLPVVWATIVEFGGDLVDLLLQGRDLEVLAGV